MMVIVVPVLRLGPNARRMKNYQLVIVQIALYVLTSYAATAIKYNSYQAMIGKDNDNSFSYFRNRYLHTC